MGKLQVFWMGLRREYITEPTTAQAPRLTATMTANAPSPYKMPLVGTVRALQATIALTETRQQFHAILVITHRIQHKGYIAQKILRLLGTAARAITARALQKSKSALPATTVNQVQLRQSAARFSLLVRKRPLIQ